MYNVKKGTEGYLLEYKGNNTVHERSWIVRKDVSFSDMDLVMDPIFLHNNPDKVDLNKYSHQWAARGYFVFRNGDYALIVHFNDVECIC